MPSCSTAPAHGDAGCHANASGSVKGPASLPMVSRCDPVPSGETPASFARERRLYSASLTSLGVVANSTYPLPKLFGMAPGNAPANLPANCYGTTSRTSTENLPVCGPAPRAGGNGRSAAERRLPGAGAGYLAPTSNKWKEVTVDACTHDLPVLRRPAMRRIVLRRRVLSLAAGWGRAGAQARNQQLWVRSASRRD